ncbi:MAG: EAL domain-containing protein [Gammaproteobacteria bacterium]|nr:EAL domain-containing protein [Gammaproteobacteria bacterium]
MRKHSFDGSHPEKGLIPPLEFLPLVEGTDLEIAIGNWVIEQALAQLDQWLEHGIELEVSINVSSYHIHSATFFTVIKEALQRYPNVNSQYLQLEILESMALGDIDKMSQIIKTCQNELGISVALDDFGTGYSSLAHIRRLSAQTIKIDQSFVKDVLDDPNDYTIIDGIIGLADSFNRDIIAEGVETAEHGLMLLIMGCDKAQGYSIARPMPAKDFTVWYTSYQHNPLWKGYTTTHHSTQEDKIILLQLTTKHWYQQVLDLLTHNKIDETENYLHKCHLGKWVSRFEKEGMFASTWLNKLKEAHDTFYFLATELHSQHHAGETNLVIEKKNELETAYRNVQHFFEPNTYILE